MNARQRSDREARRLARNLFWHARREFESSRWRLQLDPHIRRESDGHRLLGQNFPDDRRIVVYAHEESDGSLQSTLLHELLHAFFPAENAAAEGKVGEMERDVFSRLLPSEVRWLTRMIRHAEIVLEYSTTEE